MVSLIAGLVLGHYFSKEITMAGKYVKEKIKGEK